MGSGNVQSQLTIVLDKSEEGKQCLMSPDYCLHSKGDKGCHNLMRGKHVHKLWRIQIVYHWCRLLKAYRPWLILHIVGWFRCRLADAHTPRQMHGCLSWLYFLLANVACQKCKCLGWCFLMLVDSNFAQKMYKFHKTCVQALADVFTIGRHL